MPGAVVHEPWPGPETAQHAQSESEISRCYAVPMLCRLLALALLASTLAGCGQRSGPCYWDGQQDRDTGKIQAMRFECDGVATDPAVIHVRYRATSGEMAVALDTNRFVATLAFDPSLPDGTYPVEGPAGVGQTSVTATGAEVTGNLTFSRSRDVPFLDILEPEAKIYTSTIDVDFDLSAVLPNPDPAMGPGCRLATGEQHVSLLVTGPVVECKPGFATGH